jgi:uncharacterized phage protein (TIGR02220 family)
MNGEKSTKSNIILYESYEDALGTLEAGEFKKLIMSLYEYRRSGTIPSLAPEAQMAFKFITSQMERDRMKYEAVCERRRQAGKKGGMARAVNANQKQANESNSSNCKQKLAIQAKQAKEKENEKENKNEKEKENKNEKEISSIISYLNDKTGKHFRNDASETIKHINGRLSEGYTVEDFHKVIDEKCNEWLNDSKMSRYLQPSTLFSIGHFEQYLNQSSTPKKQKDYDWFKIEEQLLAETDRTLNNNTP